MKRILIALTLVVLLIQPLWASTTIDELRNQVKMTLAQGEPEITDVIINDFLILAIQNVAVHGLACQLTSEVYCSSATKSYVYEDTSIIGVEGIPDYYARGQGLFIKALSKDYKTPANRSIWEISPSALRQKWLVNPPAYQYYYLWFDEDKSYFSLYDPAVVKDTLVVTFYYVPTTFYEETGIVSIPTYYEDVVIEYVLFLCYLRLKDPKAAFTCYNKYSKNLSAIREIHINRQPDMTFGSQQIEK